nr:immunoglobulin light chain junction region [Macaca mulatta]MOX85585.1 immunoglobulin light chain junction region [Macaca mulatta]
CMQVLEFPHSF